MNIYDCFEYNQKEEHFIGENAMYCNVCRIQCPSMYATYLYTPPQILILVLNRGQGIQFKIKLEFPQEFNISPYISQNQGGINYKLIGVITHLGESNESGHFIAHCLSPIDNNWYTYNDATVTLIKNIKTDVIDLGMPYLLFYQRERIE